MALTAGMKLGPYEVLGALGAGGMGEVYRARDTRLERTVAIKVLPSHLSSNADLKQRFEREAKAISSLNHPHICTLHDVGSQDGVDFLVMEYLEGETLAERLVKGPVKIEEALKIAVGIADALDKAHRQGIVHRDLKPGNVMLTKSGAKLMDFGLAKPAALAMGAGSHPSNPGPGGAPFGSVTPNTPTMSVAALTSPASPLTQKGTIVGTFQYMAPEVLQGAEADARSDIFSFGCLLYEMITGRRAFEGKSQVSVLAAILDKEPEPIMAVQPLTPAALEHAITTCLAKDPEQRWQSAGDVARELRWAAQVPESPALMAEARTKREAWWMAACVVLLAAVAVTGWLAFHQPKPSTLRLQIAPPEKSSFGYGLALSPDGSQFCFVVTGSMGQSSLACRSLNSVVVKMLAGTEGAQFPFWSPDGSAVAFFAGGRLKKVDLASGSVQLLADAPDGRGGDWGRNGDIIYSPSAGDNLYRISGSGGGRPTPITKLGQEISHRWPHFLPDGKHYLYFGRTAQGQPEEKIYVGTLGSSDRQELMMASAGVTAIPGYVVYIRGKTLFAQQFDESKLRLEGEPIALVDGVEPEGESGPTAYSPFTVSQNGVLIYQLSQGSNNQLAWFDRSGKHLQDIAAVNRYDQPALSPDGTRLAIDRYDENGSGVWILDLARGTFTRFSLSTKAGNGGIWSPDGKEIVFSGNGLRGGASLYHKASSGAGPEELLPETSGYPDCFSPDGRVVMYESFEVGKSNQANLWVLPMSGDRKPYRYLPDAGYNRTHAAFSPDGRWVAYTSDESGRIEIYVQSYPDPRTKLQVSTDGGDQAQWSREGKELYYLALDHSIVSVPVDTRSDFVAQKPRTLFSVPIRVSTGANDSRANYAVSHDGKRFLINTLERQVSSQPLTVVLNWAAELKKK